MGAAVDDWFIAAIIERPEKIDEALLRRRAEEGRLSDEEADLICQHILHSRGRNFLEKAHRDIRINIVVEALQEKGASFRAACARVAPFVYLSAEGVTSICQKERRRGG